MKQTKLFLLLFTVLVAICCNPPIARQNADEKPNIVLIYLDDLGYGDTGVYGATEIKTPNIDNIAEKGIVFTNGYASSATCSPSRYSLLTGIYPWRNSRARVLPGTAPLIIDTAEVTFPEMLRRTGYYTGIVGKWHLGLGDGEVDWNGQISPGPNEVGFDYSYILAATQDRIPTVYIENGRVIGLDADDPIEVSYAKNFEGEPTGKDNPEMLKMMWQYGHNGSIVNGISRIGFMKGGEKARWVDENMADTFLVKAQDFILSHKEGPFFLYYAMQQPHVPRTPNERFVGKTSLGPRGDVVAEADWCIGELYRTLESNGLLENTIVIISSDNGPVLNDGYYDDAVEMNGNHSPGGPLRGGKYSLFEAGTRVPFIVSWKNRVFPARSDAIVSQIDLFSSFARLTGSQLRGTDSQDILDALLGQSDTGRNELIIEASGRTALRCGDWIMIPPYPGPEIAIDVNIELGNSAEYQLYNLKDDIGEQVNLATSEPKRLLEMISIYDSLRFN